MLAGVGGLLSDTDIPVSVVLGALGYSHPLLQHGGITHTLFFGLLFLVPGLLLWSRRKHKDAVVLFVIAFGVFFHVFLDVVVGGGGTNGVMAFWPLSDTLYKAHLIFRLGIEPHDALAALDALLLLGWLWHEQTAH